jgi:hypothetical protein
LGGNVHAVRKNTEALVAAAKEIGLEVNADKIKYMVMSRDQNAGQNSNIWDLQVVGWGEGGIDWIYLSQDRDRWQAVVKAVMNLCVP